MENLLITDGEGKKHYKKIMGFLDFLKVFLFFGILSFKVGKQNMK
jgi:hypothetical protein